MKTMARLLKCCSTALWVTSIGGLVGCAATKDTVDPYEKYNRAVFKFNRSIDTVIARPVADLYDTVTPAPIQGGIGRMYSNFYEPSRVINDLLQGEMRFAYQDGARFVVNSTVGLAGYFDVAQHVGYGLHPQDFGITMARWGWHNSAYVVMPLLGVYTVRDLFAVPVNSYAFTFWPYIQPENVAWKLYFLEKTHTRAVLRPADKVIDEAFDPYLFVRDAYLQKRSEDITSQQMGRTSVVKPAPEHADDQSKAEASVAQGTEATVGKAAVKPETVKPTSGKSLPDVISLEETPVSSHPVLANQQAHSTGEAEDGDRLG